ncbi:MAG TPA: class I SAM-dependent methyltransferase [Anaerolineales bacterium]|nr:class I SAM-dependent methyltransferase [Anaerolineales bacterium]
MPAVILKPGREKSVLRRHPWIFSGAVEGVAQGSALRNGRAGPDDAPGATVDVVSSKGDFLARGAYSPRSQIRVRVWTFEDESVDREFFRKRIRAALDTRSSIFHAQDSNAVRLIYAEADGMPGLIVDRYADHLVLQSLTAGSEYWKETIADILLEETGSRNIYERSDADVRELEGLAPRVGILRGALPDPRITITEHGLKFHVDLERGQKTGFYLDQRVNRQRVRAMAQEKEVLDCFCYTGGFTVNAVAGAARTVLAVDASSEALTTARQNIELNGLPLEKVQFLQGDVFQVLRKLRDEARTFDMIILDPPKFAPTAAQAQQAARGYKDINLLAFKLLRANGILFTFSCSGGVEAGLFQKIVASAALDAGAEAQIIEHLSQASDHPVLLHFPEAAYLKGLVCTKK